MATETRATIADLARVEGRAELVAGRIVRSPPVEDAPIAAGFD